MTITEFPKAAVPDDERTDDLIAVVGFKMILEFVCQKCGPTVLVCLGKAHEVACPHCRRAYRLSFLHYDPDDPATHAPDGTPQIGINIVHRRLDGVIVPALHRTPPTGP